MYEQAMVLCLLMAYSCKDLGSNGLFITSMSFKNVHSVSQVPVKMPPKQPEGGARNSSQLDQGKAIRPTDAQSGLLSNGGV